MTKRRRLRIAALSSAALALLLIAVAAVLLRDPEPHFTARRSSLRGVREGAPVMDGGYVLTPAHVTARSGLTVDLLVRRAVADSGRRVPLVVILGGHYSGRDAARMVGESRSVVVAALSYPFDGDLRPGAATFLRQIPRIRAAFLDTPPAIMLALDYLLRLPGVDTSRVEAVGVSLGAPFMTIAGAMDQRFTRVWSLHGSGGSYRPLEASMRETIRLGPVRAIAAAIATVVIDGPWLDPVRWAPRIAPRQFIMVNAAADERLPRSSVEALFRAAREPKELIWMEGAHIHADAETIRRLIEIVMARVGAPAP